MHVTKHRYKILLSKKLRTFIGSKENPKSFASLKFSKKKSHDYDEITLERNNVSKNILNNLKRK